MSDLIRREDVTRLVNKFVFGLCKAQNDEVIKIFNKYVEKIPTAYDIDKVVEELEERTDFLKDCTKYGNKNAKQQAESYNTMMMYEVADLVDDLIEIVKHGGVGTETETIRDKAVKWNNNSSKRVPYEFIDYVEGKREICVSDDVCEWKVKSNYYVTECSHDTDVMYGLKQDFKFCPYCSKKIKAVE